MSPVANNNIVCNIMFRSPRGATRRNSSRMVSCMFQSTFPRGERHTANHGCLFWEMFQSTLPRGERPPSNYGYSEDISFNPRSRVGSDACKPYHIIVFVIVSIHAPAWGATAEIFNLLMSGNVSIHAPAWGATLSAISVISMPESFNPRSRVGSDCS